jgi:dienelactone hydrolase
MIVATQPQTLLCAALLACAGCSNASAPSTSSAATAAAGSTTITLPAGASGSAAVSGSSGAPIEMPAPAGPVLPQVSDPAQPGPFGVEVVATAPGLDTHKLYVPTKLGDNGLKHPIIVWTNGAGGSTDFYENLLRHFASHGFFVVADKMSGSTHDPEIVEQKAGIEWAIAEATRVGSPYAGKLDASRLAVAGHSLGSIASFASAAHPAVKASIHWSAGLTGNPVGADESWLQGLHAPAAFFCGGAEARALPRCSGDFDNAPANVPIFYGTLEGVGHTDVYGEPEAGQWGRAGVAWFRFTLAGDESFRAWFQAPTCTLCSSPWTGKSRGI